MPENRHLRVLVRLGYAALAAGGLWLAWRVVLPCLLPFLAALGLAALLEPAVRFLTRRLGLGRRLAAGLCAGALTGALLGGLGLLVWRAWYELNLLLDRLPALIAGLPDLAGQVESRVYRFLIALPVPAQEPARQLLERWLEQGAALPQRLYEWLTGAVAAGASALPAALLFLTTTLLALYLLSAGGPQLLEWTRRQLPAPWLEKARQLGGGLKTAFGGWLRAQLLLMLLTFGELTAGLLALRVDLALLLAGLIALLDALPVFGAGAVLVPWGLVALLGGNVLLGAGLLVLCAVVMLVRSLLEPRLVGKRVGLHPLAALVSMYAGFQLLGVAGMVLAPLLAVLGKQLWASGVFSPRPPSAP